MPALCHARRRGGPPTPQEPSVGNHILHVGAPRLAAAATLHRRSPRLRGWDHHRLHRALHPVRPLHRHCAPRRGPEREGDALLWWQLRCTRHCRGTAAMWHLLRQALHKGALHRWRRGAGALHTTPEHSRFRGAAVGRHGAANRLALPVKAHVGPGAGRCHACGVCCRRGGPHVCAAGAHHRGRRPPLGEARAHLGLLRRHSRL